MTDNADLLYCCKQVADYLKIKPAAVYHIVETKRIPVFRVGRTLCARRAKLNDAFEKLEAQAEVA